MQNTPSLKLLILPLFACLTACNPIDRITVGFGHDVNTVPEEHSKGPREGKGEFTYKASFVNPIVRFKPLIERDSFSVHPVVELELTDKDSSFVAIGSEIVFPVFEHGEVSVLGTTGIYESDLTTGGFNNTIENISFGFHLGYSHELAENIWLGLHFNHLSDAEIGKYNNATRDGIMLTIGHDF